MKKKSVKSVAESTWKAFSEYIRLKRALETTGIPFLCVCITCGKQYHISYIDPGHFIAGRSNAVLFTEKFVHGQCRYCNQVLHGNTKRYRFAMEQTYNICRDWDIVEHWENRLRRRSKGDVITDSQVNWELRTKRYRLKSRKLLRLHGYKTWGDLLKAGK